MLSYTVGALIFFALMIALVWLGGMKGVAITDAAQGVFMFAGLLGGSLWVILANFPINLLTLIHRNYSRCPDQMVLSPRKTGFPVG